MLLLVHVQAYVGVTFSTFSTGEDAFEVSNESYREDRTARRLGELEKDVERLSNAQVKNGAPSCTRT